MATTTTAPYDSTHRVGDNVGTTHHHIGSNNGVNNGANNYGANDYDNDNHGGANHTIFLRPIAAPEALGLAGFAGSTWIVSSWIAGWWSGNPLLFFPFVMMWGGVAQFIAGIKGFPARDILATVFHTLWGSFWISFGIIYLLAATGSIPALTLHGHFSEFGSWAVVLMVFTWICAIGALGRDLIFFALLASLAFGSTLATAGWYVHGGSSGPLVKAAAYFWMLSSLLAVWRVAAFIFEENLGKTFVPIFRTRRETAANGVSPGYGESGVKRGMTKPADGNAAGTGTGMSTGVGRKSRYSGETGTTRV